MSHYQSEAVLEEKLLKQLTELGYERVVIKDRDDLLANLKKQIEKHNKIALTATEFDKVLNHLNKGNIFERANTLRDKMQLTLDNGESVYLEFLQLYNWCQNEYQVSSQITNEGKYKNRYDVTLLVNGMPLVQIELKRRGIEMKEAFNQINRYQRHSYSAGHGLFQYIQVFVISNGVNTKYYANNPRQSFKQTFYWAEEDNKVITELSQFAEIFLEPCHISKMICKYTVLNEARKILMVLRPYQYYAVERITKKVMESTHNGYIWHTTGSGKTLTSFKASQIIMENPKVHKVLFVVDRKDLDYQTAKEFNSFSAGSVDGTDDTRKLVKQLSDDTKLIVTTIQKLNNAINSKYLSKKIDDLKDKKVVLIFDECHRSQFGDTHTRIKKFFTKAQMFGFTGTPIFADNAVKNDKGKRTTKDLFGDCLHKYVISDAIRDENVLPFSVEYIGRFEQKEQSKRKKSNLDIEVQAIDSAEAMMSDDRIEKIAKYIIGIHNSKTRSRDFTGMFCVSSIEMLLKYYSVFKKLKEKGEHNLKIATIFSYVANEDDKDADGMTLDADYTTGKTENKHTRERLDDCIADYNEMFGCKYSTKDSQSFYNYNNDIAKRVKNKQIDILLVVSMFLTGFDSPMLNTLYVDKNLRYHGLIQAYSRTNRIVGEQKPHGNIVCFRNLKTYTDEAIALFSDKDAKEEIFVPEYDTKLKEFAQAYEQLAKLTPEPSSVDDLEGETAELGFIRAFRELMRLKNELQTYVEYESEDLPLSEQKYEDFKSKYLDLYEKVKTGTKEEKESILDEVDFMLELIHRDEINVDYILRLLAKLKLANEEDQEKQKKAIIDLLSSDIKLRPKRELIEKFINENLPEIDVDSIDEEFDKFWDAEQKKAFKAICKEESIQESKFSKLVENYIFTNREPLRNDFISSLDFKPSALKRKSIYERIVDKFRKFIDTFYEGR
jgi:type I restriction enzyme R subunit